LARQPKRILFQGLGGAGQRHLRIFRSLLPDAEMFAWRRARKTPLLKPDLTVDSSGTLEERYAIRMVSSIEEGYALSPDLVVIATPSSLHAEAVLEAVHRGVDVFVEKPAAISVDQSRAIESAVRAGGVDFFVSFQRRFHPLVQRMRSVLASGTLGEIMSVRINVASHVPDWHAYEDFHDLYACRADLGGGVLRTESHELDLVGWLFGMPQRVSSVLGCRGPHRLGVEDSADLLLDYGDYAIQVSLCFMQRHQERRIVINGRDGWLDCDLLLQRLEVGRHSDGDVEVVGEAVDMGTLFTAQAEYFLDGFEHRSTEYLEAIRNLTSLVEAVDAAAGKGWAASDRGQAG